jgi:hypothetical protein
VKYEGIDRSVVHQATGSTIPKKDIRFGKIGISIVYFDAHVILM